MLTGHRLLAVLATRQAIAHLLTKSEKKNLRFKLQKATDSPKHLAVFDEFAHAGQAIRPGFLLPVSSFLSELAVLCCSALENMRNISVVGGCMHVSEGNLQVLLRLQDIVPACFFALWIARTVSGEWVVPVNRSVTLLSLELCLRSFHCPGKTTDA